MGVSDVNKGEDIVNLEGGNSIDLVSDILIVDGSVEMWL